MVPGETLGNDFVEEAVQVRADVGVALSFRKGGRRSAMEGGAMRWKERGKGGLTFSFSDRAAEVWSMKRLSMPIWGRKGCGTTSELRRPWPKVLLAPCAFFFAPAGYPLIILPLFPF